MADDESSTSDESLDAKSDKFNPMKALYSSKMQLSSRKAPIYDNIAKYEAVMSGLSGQLKVRISRVMARATRTLLPRSRPSVPVSFVISEHK